MDLNFALESSESHYRGSFSRGIRIFGSQDVIRGSKPNCLGKTYPRKKLFFKLVIFLIGSLGYIVFSMNFLIRLPDRITRGISY